MQGTVPFIVSAGEWTLHPLAFTELLIVVAFFVGLFVLEKVSAHYDREKERAREEASKIEDGRPPA